MRLRRRVFFEMSPPARVVPNGGRGLGSRMQPRFIALRVVVYVLGACTSVLVARLLGPFDRGLWAIALVIAGIVGLVTELGIGSSLLHLSRSQPERRPAVLGASIGIVGFGGVAGAFAVLAVTWLGWGPAESLPLGVLLPALCGVGIANVTSALRQALLERGDLGGALVTQLCQAGSLLLLLIFGLVALRGSVGTAMGAYLASLCVTLAVTVWIARKAPSLALGWDWSLVAPLLRYGLVAHVAVVSLFMAYRLDLLLVNHFMDPAAAGVYSVALTLSEMLRAIPELAQMTVFSRSSRGDGAQAAQHVCGAAAALTAAIGLLAAGASFWLVGMVFGAAFQPAALAFTTLVPGMVGLAISYTLSPVLVLRGQVGVCARAALLSLALMIALDALMIPRFGLVGAGVASSAAYLSLALVQWNALREQGGFPLRSLLPSRGALREVFGSPLKDPSQRP